MFRALNVLVFGSGARECAICDSIFKSPYLKKLFLAEPCFFEFAEIIDFADYSDLIDKCLNMDINLVIIGPEAPICDGLADLFLKNGIRCIGVNQKFSKLESSKLFAKKIMQKYGISTAKFSVFDEHTANPENQEFPVVLKADGLCKGKGVEIAYSKEDFIDKISKLKFNFSKNAETILVEEFLNGDEISLMSIFDGKSLVHFPPSRDFKKLSDSKFAPNTGGMGSFCPVFLTEKQQRELEIYKSKLQSALLSENADFVGFIYSGLIWAEDRWFVLEYNVRLGDPEAQSILPLIKSDFLELLIKATENNLSSVNLEFESATSACLVIAAEGYPECPKDGEVIILPEDEDVKIYYAGVKKNGETLYSKGGRILSLCTTVKNPFSKLKDFADKILMKNKYYRADIDI